MTNLSLGLNFKQIRKFWRKVRQLGPDDCWEWQGSKRGAYGVVELGGIKTGAHQLAWAIAHPTEEQGGLVICHKCDNPPCCNPAHLFLGSSQVNAIDMVSKGRAVDNSGERHGQHVLTAEQVEEIRLSRESGAALARRLGVHRATISRIRRGQRWSQPATASADPPPPAASSGSIDNPPPGHSS